MLSTAIREGDLCRVTADAATLEEAVMTQVELSRHLAKAPLTLTCWQKQEILQKSENLPMML